MDITVTVRDGADVELLSEIADQQWRQPEQQASAFIEQALATARARKNQAPRAQPGRRSRNGMTAIA